MKRKALFMVLSEKAKNDSLVIVDSFDLKQIKTKDLKEKLDALKLEGSTLIVLENMNDNIIKSARNIEKVDTIQAKDLNVLDLMTFKNVITTKEGIEKIKETFLSAK